MFLHKYGVQINSNINNILDEVKIASSHKYSYVQFFVNANPKHRRVYKKLSKYLSLHKITPIIHISYTINIARNWDEHSWWIQQFIDEIKVAHMLNACAVVVHLGKHMHLSMASAYNNMLTTLLYVNNKTSKYKNVNILLETSSGSGTEMCSDINDLAYFFTKLKKHAVINKRFGICIDTCHVFAAGYNIRSIKFQEKFFSLFDSLIGLKYVKLLHLNDSKYKLNSHLDRHADIDFGHIGLNALSHFYDYLSIPTILETPTTYAL